MAIPGTLTYEGPDTVTQEQFDTIPSIGRTVRWLRNQGVSERPAMIRGLDDPAYKSIGFRFQSDATTAEALADYGFDVYDQGSGAWIVVRPNDITVSG